MDANMVQDWLRGGWGLVRRAGDDVSHIVRTALPMGTDSASNIYRTCLAVATNPVSNQEPMREVTKLLELQVYMEKYGLDMEVEAGDRDMRAEIMRYLSKKHHRSASNAPLIRPS